MLEGGKARNGGARSAPLARKENKDNGLSRAGSSGGDSSMVRKLRNQAAAYADSDRNPYSSGVNTSAAGRGAKSVRGTVGSNPKGKSGSGIVGSSGLKKKGPVGKPVDYDKSNVFDSRAKSSFDTSTDTKEGYGNASGNYNRNSYKGNASGSGLREGAKTALDVMALVSNFESGEGVAK